MTMVNGKGLPAHYTSDDRAAVRPIADGSRLASSRPEARAARRKWRAFLSMRRQEQVPRLRHPSGGFALTALLDTHNRAWLVSNDESVRQIFRLDPLHRSNHFSYLANFQETRIERARGFARQACLNICHPLTEFRPRTRFSSSLVRTPQLPWNCFEAHRFNRP